MDEINPLSNPNRNQINLKSEDKNENKIESISEKQRNFSEFKEIIKSFSNIYWESNNPEIVNKQIELIQSLPKVLKESMGNNINNYYSCNINKDLIKCFNKWRGNDTTLYLDDTNFKRRLAQWKNNNNGVQDCCKKMGINLDLSKKYNELFIAKNILPYIVSCSNKFLVQFLLDLASFKLLAPQDAYSNFLTILDRCYNDKLISNSDDKLVLRTILYNLVDNGLSNVGSLVCTLEHGKTTIDRHIENFIEMLLSITSKDTNILEKNYHILGDNILLSLISKIIKQLAKVEYTNNRNDNYHTISNKIIDETIFPIFKDCVFEKYLKCLLEKHRKHEKCSLVSETDLFNQVNDILEQNGEIRKMLINKFNVYKLVEETITELQTD